MMVFIISYHRQNYSVKYTEYWNTVVLLEEFFLKNKETNALKVKKKHTHIYMCIYEMWHPHPNSQQLGTQRLWC